MDKGLSRGRNPGIRRFRPPASGPNRLAGGKCNWGLCETDFVAVIPEAFGVAVFWEARSVLLGHSRIAWTRGLAGRPPGNPLLLVGAVQEGNRV
jgi:hypothetical protein